MEQITRFQTGWCRHYYCCLSRRLLQGQSTGKQKNPYLGGIINAVIVTIMTCVNAQIVFPTQKSGFAPEPFLYDRQGWMSEFPTAYLKTEKEINTYILAGVLRFTMNVECSAPDFSGYG